MTWSDDISALHFYAKSCHHLGPIKPVLKTQMPRLPVISFTTYSALPKVRKF